MGRKILLSETELKSIIKKIISEAIKYNPEVENAQKELQGKYDLGKFGPKGDGVDGKLGRLTKKAMRSEFEKNSDFKKKYEHLLPNEEEISKEKIVSKSEDGVVKGVDTPSSQKVILMGGLDYRKGDYKIDGQIDILKRGMDTQSQIVGYRFNDLNSVLDSIKQNPDAKVVLFSAGCQHANKIAQYMDNPDNLYIVEPYAAGQKTKNAVQSAVSNGVPETNVVVGPSVGRGRGVVDGATKTPSGVGHWGALEFVGSKIS